MTDLGPLLAAVRNEWERAVVIADRADVNRRSAGQKLSSLVRQRLVVESFDKTNRMSLYRRGPAAPPLIEVPTPVQELERDLHAKLAEMRLHDDTGDPVDRGYMQALDELGTWLDERCDS